MDLVKRKLVRAGVLCNDARYKKPNKHPWAKFFQLNYSKKELILTSAFCITGKCIERVMAVYTVNETKTFPGIFCDVHFNM